MNYEERYAAYLQAIEEYLSGLFHRGQALCAAV